ncbi:hypothetical protein GCM10027051_31450 [Niabella terrae]
MSKSKKEPVKGYKVTDSNMQCRGFQYELNKEFVHENRLSPCNAGFHFCKQAQHCFNYYEFKTENRVFEIEALGNVIDHEDKSVTDKIVFIREVPWDEVLKIANTGSNNTGHSNSGDRNSGDRNSGYSNSGDSNSGDSNSGDSNSGYRNSGYSNSGYRNSGNWNSGDRNSGDSNSGNWNSGNWNSGDSNSGYRNSGDSNSGDSNSGYRNSGAFCTDNDPKIPLFNKPSEMSAREWENHPAYKLMGNIDPTIWVPWSAMTKEEREANPKYEASKGYTKSIPLKEAWANFWQNLSDDNKKHFTTLPNFDKKIFFEITGVEV